jgi:hypothetical protein
LEPAKGSPLETTCKQQDSQGSGLIREADEGAAPLKYPSGTPARGSLIIDLLQHREERLTLVELMNGQLLSIQDIAWGRDPDDEWEHVTINFSPRRPDVAPDYFSTRDVSRILDPDSGSILMVENAGPRIAPCILPRRSEPGPQPLSLGQGSLITDLLYERRNTLTIVELDDRQLRSVLNLGSGIDIGDYWEHVTITNTEQNFDFFYTSQIVRLRDPVTGSSLLNDRIGGDPSCHVRSEPAAIFSHR